MLHTRTLWWIHSIHHEKREPTFLDTYHGHWIENPFQGIGFLLPIPFGYVSGWPFVLGFCIVNLRGVLRHDARMAWLVGNHHLIHHKDARVNFGDYWIDWLFDTQSRSAELRP